MVRWQRKGRLLLQELGSVILRVELTVLKSQLQREQQQRIALRTEQLCGFVRVSDT